MYRKIDDRFWQDDKVRTLSFAALAHLLALLNHPDLTMAGTVRTDVSSLAVLLNTSRKCTRGALNELLRVSILESDKDGSVLWFPRFLKYNTPGSPNAARGVQLASERVWFRDSGLDGRFRSTIRHYLRDFSHLRWEAPSEAPSEATSEAPSSGAVEAPSEAPSSGAVEAPGERTNTNTEHKHKHTASKIDAVTRARETDEPEASPEPTATAELRSSATPRTPEPLNGSTTPPPSVTQWGPMPTRKRLGRMAWEARRVGLSVPAHLHAEFLSKMAQPPDERALVAFYGRTEDALPDDAAVGEDVHDFWRNHFRAWQGSASLDAKALKRKAESDAYAKAKADAEAYERAQLEGRRTS